MRMWMALAVCWCVASGHARAEEQTTMKDLQALASQESWAELMRSMGQIKPSARNGAWKKLLEKGAIGYLDTLSQSTDPRAALGNAEAFVMEYPVLKKSKRFMKKRADVGLKAFRLCFSQRWGGGECVTQVQRFSDVDPKDKKFAFEAAKMIRVGFNGASALPLFLRGVPSKNAKQCRDKQVGLAISQGFGVGDKSSEMAAKLAERCYRAQKTNVLKELRSESGTTRVGTCKFMLGTHKKDLRPFEVAYCKDAVEKAR